MAIYRFPKNSDDDSSRQSEPGPKRQKFEGKLPDFIYVGDDSQNSEENGDEKSSFKSFSAAKNFKSYPIFFRFLTLVVSISLAVWTFLLGIAALITAFVALILFLKAEEVNKLALSLWKTICKISVFSLALFVATLSPSFGFGILALYLSQHHLEREGFINKLFSRFF